MDTNGSTNTLLSISVRSLLAHSAGWAGAGATNILSLSATTTYKGSYHWDGFQITSDMGLIRLGFVVRVQLCEVFKSDLIFTNKLNLRHCLPGASWQLPPPSLTSLSQQLQGTELLSNHPVLCREWSNPLDMGVPRTRSAPPPMNKSAPLPMSNSARLNTNKSVKLSMNR